MSTTEDGAMSSTEPQPTDAREVGLDDLSGSKGREDYNQLVIDTARLVDDGLFKIAEVRPDGLVAEGETPSEAFIERFRDDVRAELDNIDSAAVGDDSADREPQQTTTDATQIDWPRLWVNAGVPATKPLSWTQAALAVDVSEQTPTTDQGAKALLEDAIAAGLVNEFRERQRVAPVEVSE